MTNHQEVDLPLVELRTGADDLEERSVRRSYRSVERLVGVIVVLSIWQFAAWLGWLTPDILAGPLNVLGTAWDLLTDGTLMGAIWASLQRVVFGLAIGIPVGIGLAVVSGLSRAGENLVDSPMQMIRFLPVIALQPLFLLWFGIGNEAKIALISFGVVFPVYINTSVAIRSIDPRNLELARTVGLSRWGTIRRVVLPAATPAFLVGLRMAVAISWLILVFAEQINAREGVGALVIKAQTFFLTDVIVVCLGIYAVLGLLSDFGVRLLERKVLQWQPGR
jgi:sulfonate transport system permease protein